LPKGVKLDLLLIPPGQFRMGTDGDKDKETPRDVTITKPFYMAVTETTQEQYEAVTGKRPSSFHVNGSYKERLGSIVDTSKFPVEHVTCLDAEDFCNKVNARLPTEAQWEYACRAGTLTNFHFGNSLNGTEANCRGNSPFETIEKGPSLERTTKVASYQPNAFGMFDMHGNVAEWCWDWYADKTDDLAANDPERKANPSLDRRILRGGSWDGVARASRSASRDSASKPEGSSGYIGFRVMVVVP
ncbi:MAG: formylglycine-generating enzyme family protein, partial [Planctomycetes bacterium]|nr:formylglycine-generating enzyme family protein [Planctomycetota bacterium]